MLQTTIKTDTIMSLSLRGLGELELLASESTAKMVHFHIAEIGPVKEQLLGSGIIQLIRAVSINTVFLKMGRITHPLLPRTRTWRIGNCFIFPVVTSFWRLELRTKAADVFARELAKVTRFQRDPLPFDGSLMTVDDSGNIFWAERTRRQVEISPTTVVQPPVQSVVITALSQDAAHSRTDHDHSVNGAIYTPTKSAGVKNLKDLFIPIQEIEDVDYPTPDFLHFFSPRRPRKEVHLNIDQSMVFPSTP